MSRDPHAIAPQISQAAAEWFIIMREATVPEAERAAFSAWLQASPVHVRAYLEVAGLWGDAAQLDPELPVDVDCGQAAANVLPMREPALQRRDAGTTGADPASIGRRRKVGRRQAVAASIALLAGLVGMGVWWHLQQPPTYVTQIGEQRVITLDDGSIMRLNSRSEVKVQLLPAQRLVELVDGQALFEVASEPQRPFIVRSGNVTARAIGTQFDVYRKPTGTVVTVLEGQVEVRAEPEVRTADAGALATPVSIRAGEQVIVGRAGAIEQHSDANVNAAIRWLQQELVFENQPLSAVVEEFNRYQRIPIVLDDPELGGLRVNAVFHTTGPESLLKFVGRMEDVQVERSAREIRITGKQ